MLDSGSMKSIRLPTRERDRSAKKRRCEWKDRRLSGRVRSAREGAAGASSWRGQHTPDLPRPAHLHIEQGV
jgi:hypothetical protein